MADESPIVVMEPDVADKVLLLRLLRKMSDATTNLRARLGRLERTPPPPTYAQIRDALQANGSAPLNITALIGQAGQPQLAGTPRSTSAPSGSILQQFKDTQLLLVGTTSTGFNLNTVVGGNPNVLYQLLGGLTTASVTSTTTNYVTLDTVQTLTTAANKVFSADQYFLRTIGIGTTVTGANLDIRATGPAGDAFAHMGVNPSTGPGFNFGYVGASLGRSVGFFNVRPDTGAAAGDPSIRFFTANTERFRADPTGLKIASANVLYFGSSAARIVAGSTSISLRDNANAADNLLITDTGNTTLRGKIVSYNQVTTTGEGVPYIISRNEQISKTSSVGTQTLYTTTSTGEYRLSFYVECIATGTSVPILSYGHNNDAASIGVTTTGLTLSNVGLFQQQTVFLRNANASAITYNVAFGTATSTSPAGTYSVFTVLERMT